MAILPRKFIAEIKKQYNENTGLGIYLADVSGKIQNENYFSRLFYFSRKKICYALEEGINYGAFFIFSPVPGLYSWIIPLENKKIVYGGLIAGGICKEQSAFEDVASFLRLRKIKDSRIKTILARLAKWDEAQIHSSAQKLWDCVYNITGWQNELLQSNRLRILQQQQLNQAIEDQRKKGNNTLYVFEKERSLLAHIRAGEKTEAKKIINEMLANIFMSSSHLSILRARTIELLSCLTRAAIEDNQLLEPLIEKNHAWIDMLVKAKTFEELSQRLMDALDEFMEEIYVHGVNRSNPKVSQAIDYMSKNFASPISLRDVAKAVNLSPFRLSHLIKRITGLSTMQILFQIRIRHAQQLLLKTDKSCTEIGYDVGFPDQSYFIKHFKRLTGVTPLRYRKEKSWSVQELK